MRFMRACSRVHGSDVPPPTCIVPAVLNCAIAACAAVAATALEDLPITASELRVVQQILEDLDPRVVRSVLGLRTSARLLLRQLEAARIVLAARATALDQDGSGGGGDSAGSSGGGDGASGGGGGASVGGSGTSGSGGGDDGANSSEARRQRRRQRRRRRHWRLRRARSLQTPCCSTFWRTWTATTGSTLRQ
jgi:hypothetical protein